MSVFADTSGLYALLVGSEEGHAALVQAFRDVLTGNRPLWTTADRRQSVRLSGQVATSSPRGILFSRS